MDDMRPENGPNKEGGVFDRIEALKQRLIATKDIKKIRPDKIHKLTQQAWNVPREWAESGNNVMKRSLRHPTFFKKFFIFSFLGLVASVVFAYFYLF